MTMKEAVKSVLSKYVDFSGRARRSEYWYFTLAYSIVAIIVGIIASVTGIKILSSILSLAVLLPSLAVGARRLHDIGKSGWWLLLCCTGIGAIIVLIWSIKDSQPGENQYGPNPKEIA